MFEQVIPRIKALGLLSVEGDKSLTIGNSGCSLVEYGIEYSSDTADSCQVIRSNLKWTMIHSEGVPTFTEDDCICDFATLDEAVNAAITYLLGGPEIIGEWTVPIHKHPEWPRNKLLILIRHARHVSWAEWSVLYKNFNQQEGSLIYAVNSGRRKVKNREFDATQVISVPHKDRSDLTLWLRRDLKESFIVYGTAS